MAKKHVRDCADFQSELGTQLCICDYVPNVADLEATIQRVRDLENEPCNDKCSSLSCQHWGIRRAVRALDGKPETGSLHGEEFTYCAAKGGEQA